MSKYSRIEEFTKKFPINTQLKNGVFIDYTYHKGKKTKSTKCFTNSQENNHTVEDIIMIISSVFDSSLKDNKRQRYLLETAVGGNGNEKYRFTRLHSSSLCAFLHYYRVSKESPIKLKIENDLIEFDQVAFEFKNPCIDKRYPSCIDVVLVSNSNNLILFLESKFTEYLSNDSKSVSKEYLKYYEKISDRSNKLTDNIEYYMNEVTNKLDLHTKTDKLYVDGIKQMISHFIGVKNFCDGDLIELGKSINDEDLNLYKKFKKNDAKVYLGEMLYSFGNENLYLNHYQEEYSSLQTNLNKITDNQFTVLPEIMTYQELFKWNENYFSKEIKDFYKYK